MEIFRVVGRRFVFNPSKTTFRASARLTGGSKVYRRLLSTISEDPKTMEFLNYLDSLKNYEKIGVPKGAGTDSDDGFDLGRMRRLMEVLGNPQSKYKVVHIAGTKGKGSTAAFLSGILRAEGYAVGCYTSPHLLTIRERIGVGKQGEPVSVEALDNLFHKKKSVIDQAVALENGSLSHFEVFTAMAFSLFAEEKVDIAVIEAGLGGARDATNIISSSELATAIITTVGAEHLAALGGSLESIAEAKSGIIKHGRPVVLGGPFLPHIEQILRDKASSMSSPVISASDPGNKSCIKGLSNLDGKPCQCCDLDIQVEKDIQLFYKLTDVKISMLGSHQLQNAATATCTALCLREQGLKISDESIRAGLEQAYLLGRSQFLTPTETESLGLPGATILLDGAHTKESSKALADTIKMTFPNAKLVLVVAMASDKDHLGFASELLSEKNVDAVFLTEVDIAGDKARLTSASLLKDCWIRAAREVGVDVIDSGAGDNQKLLEQSVDKREDQTIVATESSLMAAMKAGNQILKAKDGNQPGIIVVTGSLHIVSSVLRILQG